MSGRSIPKANVATSGVATTRSADAYPYAARRAELQACCASLQAVAAADRLLLPVERSKARGVVVAATPPRVLQDFSLFLFYPRT